MGDRDEVVQLIYRIQLGGERGVRLALKKYFELMLAGQDGPAMRWLELVTPKMPQKEKEHVLSVVSEFTKSLAYEDA